MLYTLFIGQELGTGLQGLGLKQFARAVYNVSRGGGGQLMSGGRVARESVTRTSSGNARSRVPSILISSASPTADGRTPGLNQPGKILSPDP